MGGGPTVGVLEEPSSSIQMANSTADEYETVVKEDVYDVLALTSVGVKMGKAVS